MRCNLKLLSLNMLQLLNTIDRLATDSHTEDCLSLASVQATSFSKYIYIQYTLLCGLQKVKGGGVL